METTKNTQLPEYYKHFSDLFFGTEGNAEHIIETMKGSKETLSDTVIMILLKYDQDDTKVDLKTRNFLHLVDSLNDVFDNIAKHVRSNAHEEHIKEYMR